MQIKFYFLKISCPKSDDNGHFFKLIESIKNNNIVNHDFRNVPYNLDNASPDDIFVLQIGGDVSDKRKYFKDSDLKNFENGIYALARITNINSAKKTISAEVYPFTKHVSKLDLLLFPQFLDNIGPASKGIPNQAGLYDIREDVAFSFLDYLTINNLSGQSKNLIKKFNCKDQLKNVTKQFIEKLDIKSSNSFHTYSDVLIDTKKTINNTQYENQRVRIFSSFIEWFNKSENFSKSYIGLVTIDNLIFWDETYFSNKLCIIDPKNIESSITQISNNILNNTNEEWIAFNESTSRGAPKAILGRNNYLKFLNENIDDIKNLLDHEKSATIFNEQFDVDKFGKAINESGLIYSNIILSRFISSIATKPFVLLTGLSGSGKTKLAQAFVQWISEDYSQYCIVPVGADWTNREPLLGYVNALDRDEYVMPENGALKLIIEANNNQDKPYFLILDEMNLSHVERYFADFLSVMESKDKFRLHEGPDELNPGVPHEISWPSNLFIIGTVNVDETTYMFSPKVLDRANVIEFKVDESEIETFLNSPDEVEMDKLNNQGASMGSDFVNVAQNKSVVDDSPEELKTALLLFFKELKKVGAEFGYRTGMEINRLYLQLSEINADLSEHEKIDIAIMQKLLPKLHGSRRKLCPVLETLAKLCVSFEAKEKVKEDFLNNDEPSFKDNQKVLYPLSLEKITRMYKGAIDNGFTSYAEA